jgi:hypothetical protein
MQFLERVTAPAVEPVTLADAKAQLRIELAFTNDDSLITDLIIAAREACETEVRQTFISTQWRLHIDGFPFGGGYFNRTVRQMGEGPMWLPQQGGGVFELPKGPLISVQSITYADTNNTAQTVNPSLYRAQTGLPGRVQPVFGQVWPIAAPIIDSIQILYTAGYGVDGTFAPACVRLAIKQLLAFYYENREAVGEIPDGIRAILASADHGSYA